MNKNIIKEIKAQVESFEYHGTQLFDQLYKLDIDGIFEIQSDFWNLKSRINELIFKKECEEIFNDSELVVNIKGRYGNVYPLGKKEDFVWMWAIPSNNHCRTAWTEDREDIHFVDPEGGPLISVGTNLSLEHSDLPEEFVEKIEFDKELGVYILHTTINN